MSTTQPESSVLARRSINARFQRKGGHKAYGEGPWLLFLILPIGSLIMAVRNFRAPWAKNLFWAFCVFYGATFAISEETQKSTEQVDIVRYLAEVKDLYPQQLSWTDIGKLYVKSEDIDIIRLALNVIISRFTDEPKVVLIVYSLIFGFFYSRNIWYVLNRIPGKMGLDIFLLLCCLFLVNPIWNVNGFRFYTAMHMFIYGALPFVYENKRSSLLLAATSILMHFSYILPMAVLLLFIVVPRNVTVFFAFYVVSIFTSALNITALNQQLEAYAPEKFLERTKNYRSEERVELYREGNLNEQKGVWYAEYYLTSLAWAVRLFFVFVFYRGFKLLDKRSRLKPYYIFCLMMGIIANFMSTIPSGTRYMTLFMFFAIGFLLIFFQSQGKKLKQHSVYAVASLSTLLFIVVSFRVGVYSTSINTVVGNVISAFLVDYNISLNDLIK